jgi:hypothetical protein
MTPVDIRRWIPLLLVAVTSAAGCASKGPGRDTASPSITNPPAAGSAGGGTAAGLPGTEPAAAPPRAETTMGPTGSTRRPRSIIVRWLREFAPAGGGQGDTSAAYVAFMQRDSTTTLAYARETTTHDGLAPLPEPDRSLYEGAAAACLAAFEGRTDLWNTSTSMLPTMDPASLDCWTRGIYAIWATLVEAHRVDQRVTFSRGSEPAATTCPELTGLVPDHGPRAGGYRVIVTGRNLPPALDLRWLGADVVVTATRGPDGVMTVVVPPAGPVLDVGVKISSAPRIEAPIYTNFRYDD